LKHGSIELGRGDEKHVVLNDVEKRWDCDTESRAPLCDHLFVERAQRFFLLRCVCVCVCVCVFVCVCVCSQM
jgi:hypothetical protein